MVTRLACLAAAGAVGVAASGEQGAAVLIGELVGIQLVGVLAAIGVGAALHRNGVLWLPESLCTTSIGALVGLAVRFGLPKLAPTMGFYSEVFTLLLLPIIIFQAGFGLPIDAYARNIGTILSLAVPGTLISTAAIAALMYGVGQAGVSLPLTLPEALAFASLLSATDPVATLATFSTLKVHPDLDALTSGESIGNDAMAIVLFRTFASTVGRELTEDTIVGAAVSFVKVLLGSVAIGLGGGLLATLLFRGANAPPLWLRLPACCRCGGGGLAARSSTPTAGSRQAAAARVAQLSLPAADGASAPRGHSSDGSSGGSSGGSTGPAVVGAADDWGRRASASAATAVGNPFRSATIEAGAAPGGGSSSGGGGGGGGGISSSSSSSSSSSRQLRVAMLRVAMLASGGGGGTPAPTPPREDSAAAGASSAITTSSEAFALGGGDSPALAAARDDAAATSLLGSGRHAGSGDDDATASYGFGTPMAQAAILLLIGYGAYVCAEIGQQSGIVAILVAGVAMQRYTSLLLDPLGVRVAQALLRQLSQLADCIVFFSIGLDVALFADVELRAEFVAWTVLACVISRALNVFPIAAAVNAAVWCRRRQRAYFARPEEELSKAAAAGAGAATAPPAAIPFNFQILLWHAGLRGAIAYASALSFPGPRADAVQSCTAAVVLVTSSLMGLSVLPMLNLLRIPFDRGDGGPTGYEHLAHAPVRPPGCVGVAELGLQRLLAGRAAFLVHHGVPDERAFARQARLAAAAGGGGAGGGSGAGGFGATAGVGKER